MGPGPKGAQGNSGSAGAASPPNAQDLPARSFLGLRSAVQPAVSGTHPLLVKIPLGVTQIPSRGSGVTNTRLLPELLAHTRAPPPSHRGHQTEPASRVLPLPAFVAKASSTPQPRSLLLRLLPLEASLQVCQHCPQSKPHGSLLACAVCPWPCRSLPPPLASAP